MALSKIVSGGQTGWSGSDFGILEVTFRAAVNPLRAGGESGPRPFAVEDEAK